MTDRVIVCGGRDFDDRISVIHALTLPVGTILVHGAQSGADLLAAEVWESWGQKTEAHPADWKKYGKAAGPKRNQEMVGLGARLCIAFPGGTGTADCVARCQEAGILVRKIGVRRV